MLHHPSQMDEIENEKPDPPLCIRFKVGDVAKIKKYANEVDFKHHSSWIKKVTLERAEKVLGKILVSNLSNFDTAHGHGEQICIRFSKEEIMKIRRAAIIENALPSPWIRAIVMNFIQK